jgi:hypothetical protein
MTPHQVKEALVPHVIDFAVNLRIDLPGTTVGADSWSRERSP